MKKIFIYTLFSLIAFSCTKTKEDNTQSFLTGSGIFIINEGNFMGGNGSLSFYSYDSAKIYNELFLNINERPLGDVPNSMAIDGNKAYIIVNNSGKIEVVNRNTLESIATIKDLVSPRNILFVNSTKAYVTSLYSDSVTIINLTDNTVSGFINLRRSSESVVMSGTKAFIANWVGGNEVMVINTLTDEVADSIVVGDEPESMVIDKNDKLWVLCNGGWARTEAARLICINTLSNSIESDLHFSNTFVSPSSLQIDGEGENLYYLEWGNGVCKMNITSSTLPSTSFIPEDNQSFYKFGINPVNGDLVVTDALDYQQKGLVSIYRNDGTFVSSETADIIPSAVCFKLNDEFEDQ
jgi:YVTN family beta-propeller protein